MVFVTVGSQRFPFDRLARAVDGLIDDGTITDDVIAQIGWCTYEPRNYEYERFMDRDDYGRRLDACDTLITHGGAGAIVNALKAGKRVVAMPRLACYGEHVDDHQLQILGEFSRQGAISLAENEGDLGRAYRAAQSGEICGYQSNTQRFIADLNAYLDLL